MSATLLATGSDPATPAALFAQLDELGITHETLNHAAAYTVDEAKAVRGELDGAHIKNLFLRNKKGRMWLVTCLEDRQIDLTHLAQRVGANRFSFASPERLMKYLGVIPGAVTAFATINDHLQQVTVVLDAALMDVETINLHPLVNTMTTRISPQDLLRFLEATGHPAEIVNIEDISSSG